MSVYSQRMPSWSNVVCSPRSTRNRRSVCQIPGGATVRRTLRFNGPQLASLAPAAERSVDMTSAVKSADDRRIAGAVRSSLLLSRVHRSVSSHRQRQSLYSRRSIMLISVGWLPPYWCPSRRLLRSRLEGRGLVTRSKIAPKTGAASPPVARDRNQCWCAPSPSRGGPVNVQLHLQAPEPFCLLAHGVYVLLEHDLLRRRWTDDPSQPAKVGRVPIGAAFVSNFRISLSMSHCRVPIIPNNTTSAPRSSGRRRRRWCLCGRRDRRRASC